MIVDALIRELERDETRKLHLYQDSVGKWTIGVGHNLSDRGISNAVCDLMLHEDIQETLLELDRALPWWRTLDEVRQRVLANMMFNMGAAKLLTFKQTLAFVKSAQYDAAAEAMKASKWHKQVGSRALRLEQMMRSGVAP